MNTLEDLYNELIVTDNIHEWLEEEKRDAAEQGALFEACFKLYAGLGLLQETFPELSGFALTLDNFNKHYLTPLKNKKELQNIKIKQGGDASDITLIRGDEILAISSKFDAGKTYDVGKLDLTKIESNIKYYNGKMIHIGLLTFSKTATLDKFNRCQDTSRYIQDLISDNTEYMFDMSTIERVHGNLLKKYRNIPIEEVFEGTPREELRYYFHQMLIVLKTLDKLEKCEKRLIWGLFCRAGKSFMMLQTVNRGDYIRPLYVTTKPRETYNDMKSKLELYKGFEEFKFVYYEKDEEYEFMDNQLTFVSTQFLKIHSKIIKDNFDIIFIDEAHSGGCTERTKESLKEITTPVIFLSATYSKIADQYNIKSVNILTFDTYDIYLCQKMMSNGDIIGVKHGDEWVNRTKEELSKLSLYNKFSIVTDIEDYYKNEYPQLKLMTWKGTNGLLNEADSGVSVRRMLDIYGKKRFKHPTEVGQLLERIFKFTKQKKYTRIRSFIETSRRQSYEAGSRIASVQQRTVVLCYLPVKTNRSITVVCETLIKYASTLNFMKKYIMLYNTAQHEINETDIEQALNDTTNTTAEYVLIFCGGKMREGYTQPLCDHVVLMDDTKSYDRYVQTMNRGFTPDRENDKKLTFVIDLHFQRSLYITYEIGRKMLPHGSRTQRSTMVESIMDILNPEFFDWDGESFVTGLSTYSDHIREYMENPLTSFNHILKDTNEIRIPQEIIDLVKNMVIKIKKEDMKEMVYESEMKQMKEGELYETKKADKEPKTKKELAKDIENEVKARFILTHMTPIIALRYFDNDLGYKDTLINIMEDANIYEWIIGSLEMKLNLKNIDLRHILEVIQMNDTFCDEMDSIYEKIKNNLRAVKNNPSDLSQLIDEIFKPTVHQKKTYAEVSTPYTLRQEMLDVVPSEFWTEPKKVFEPCSGKGGFLLDVIQRFMDGMKDYLPDEEERYRVVVEECLYFSEINSTNVYITNLLLNMDGKYDLNVNEGNTLELDILDKWDLDGFDLVVGNPPYQNHGKSGDNKLYLSFTSFSLNILNTDSMLLFITPKNILNYILCMDKKRNFFKSLLDIKHIVLDTPSQKFQVGSTFLYFMLYNRPYTTSTHIEYINCSGDVANDLIVLKENCILPKCICHTCKSILQKITDVTDTFEFKNILFGTKSQRIRASHIAKGVVSISPHDKYPYKIIDTINKSYLNGKYYYFTKLDNDAGKDRIMFSKKGYLMPHFDNSKDITYSDNFQYILCDKQYLSLFKSKLVDFLIFQYSTNGFDRLKAISTLRAIPLQDMDNIYTYYGLTDIEISSIEKISV